MAYTTRISLLEKMKDGDEWSWREFLQYYKPLILHIASKYSLDYHDKDELIQNVLLRFFKQQSKFVYDKNKGKFRSYLGLIIKQCIIDIFRSKKKNVPFDEKIQNDLERELSFDYENFEKSEWAKFILPKALDELRNRVNERSYQAFDLYVLQNIPAEKVAECLSLSKEQVYQTKSRHMQLLHEIIKDLKEA